MQSNQQMLAHAMWSTGSLRGRLMPSGYSRSLSINSYNGSFRCLVIPASVPVIRGSEYALTSSRSQPYRTTC